ncbi:hypothetical protein ACFGX7_04210, partial [Pasteurella multocida]
MGELVVIYSILTPRKIFITITLKVSKAFPKTVISIHPVSVIFLYLKFVLLSLSANLGKKRDRQF